MVVQAVCIRARWVIHTLMVFVHCGAMGTKIRVRPVAHWAEKLDRVPWKPGYSRISRTTSAHPNTWNCIADVILVVLRESVLAIKGEKNSCVYVHVQMFGQNFESERWKPIAF